MFYAKENYTESNDNEDLLSEFQKSERILNNYFESDKINKKFEKNNGNHSEFQLTKPNCAVIQKVVLTGEESNNSEIVSNMIKKHQLYYDHLSG